MKDHQQKKKRQSALRVREPACERLEGRMLLSAAFQVVGYLPDYEFNHFNSIDLNALTQIDYFSLVASSTGSLATNSSSNDSFSQLQTVVSAAHAVPERVSVFITIDPNSTPFLTIAQSSSATTNFVTNILKFCSTYNLDGIDLDFEPGNGSLSQAQMNSWGGFLATLHAATSSHGLKLSEAVQVSPPFIIPTAYLSDVDQYNVMAYDLNFNSSAPYSESISYLTGWANYAASGGVPKSALVFGMPFYGRYGTSWNNGDTFTETYDQIMNSYAANNGGAFPAANLDSVTISGTTIGYNGVTTVENKTQYAIQNGYGGVMIWELGQDYYTSGGAYGAPSLLPAIKSVVGAAFETWTGSVSNSWSTAGNWNFGQVPTSSTAVVINGGTPTISSPFSVASMVLNGGTTTLTSGGGVFSTTSLTINPGATLDVSNNTLLINYVANADTITKIVGLIDTGYANGAWNGQGIISSAIATADTASGQSYGIGYADSADPGNPANLPVDTIKIMFTLLGDANLDGTVNTEDFTPFSQNLGMSGMMWDDGDFNYDGTVNAEDFTAFSHNLGQSASLAASDLVSNSVQLVSQDQIASASPVVDQRHHRPTRKK